MSVLTNKFVFGKFKDDITPNTSHLFTKVSHETNEQLLKDLLKDAENIQTLNESVFFISGKLNCKIVDSQRCIIKVIDTIRDYSINPVPYQILVSVVDKSSLLKFAKEIVKEWNKVCIKLSDVNFYEDTQDSSKKITDKNLCKVFEFFIIDRVDHRLYYFIETMFRFFG